MVLTFDLQAAVRSLRRQQRLPRTRAFRTNPLPLK